MSFNYAPLADRAASLIQRFGRQYTFTRTTNGAYSPSTGRTTDESSTFTKYACIFDYTDADSAGLTIQSGDRRLLAEGYEYHVGDTVVIDSSVYRVVSVSTNNPGGTDLTANLQVRK